MILVLLFCKLSVDPCFAQKRDSLELAQEMERLNRLGDSLHRLQVAKDSAFREQLENSLRDAKRDIEKEKQKELEAATNEVLKRQDKEQRDRRKTMLLATSACMIAIIAGGIFFKRRRMKNK